MPQIIYVTPDGKRTELDVAEGTSVMQAALANGLPGMNADCGGASAPAQAASGYSTAPPDGFSIGPPPGYCAPGPPGMLVKVLPLINRPRQCREQRATCGLQQV